MSIYDQIAASKSTLETSYYTPGHYYARILDWKAGNTRPPKNLPFYALETLILASDNHEKHPVGSQATWMQTLDKDMALGNIKKAIRGILQLEEDQVTREVCEMVLAPQPETGVSVLAGTIIEVVCVNIVTKEGRDFTRPSFKLHDPAEPIPQLAHRARAATPDSDDE